MLQTHHQRISFTLRGFLNIDNTLTFTVSNRLKNSEKAFHTILMWISALIFLACWKHNYISRDSKSIFIMDWTVSFANNGFSCIQYPGKRLIKSIIVFYNKVFRAILWKTCSPISTISIKCTSFNLTISKRPPSSNHWISNYSVYYSKSLLTWVNWEEIKIK